MTIANYTTKIAAAKTVGQIQESLGEAGAEAVMIDYADRQPAAVSFRLQVPVAGGAKVPIQFRLPCNWQGVLRALERDRKVPRAACNEDQARRVAWRTVQDWIEAQLAFVEAGNTSLAELMLPHAVGKDGRTMGEAFKIDGARLLGGPTS